MFGLIRWVFWITVWVLIAATFHYTLPQVDIVRVTDTYEKRVDPGENSMFWAQADVGSDGTVANRDVFFIQTRRVKGDVMVYRNEDTGWGWPPYFKFDTSNLQAEAGDLKSTEEEPRYVAIKHYGWRNEFLTIFPNAISVKPVDGPDASKGIPWLNIFIITIFLTVVYGIWVRWRRFRIARIDPTMEAIEDDLADASGAVSSWLGSWRKKS
ncbi:DUF1523 family protein [Sulfitobacter donghicola]|uniref:DUF1523 domain-containing protein n=1 Tax=Sulfitobacter donghicola DSW-25 = KCTC 12864 = JCM 14565 TaxID=1300350 RepID=A0A073IMJ9_9RHOB|nr:DUF1523 family protein [Sulfitobacter donghicola]KEJ90820.1 hypothetical protein DSW25_02670 [Sulfitobacter donghicola DSW-25 = KCTC 12864 = JCM 14565]KIN68096.1 DUF1523 domain containing protein [Sulfitobacter donghicola DSW-25 = KCTC 12864 = JCM 14565]